MEHRYCEKCHVFFGVYKVSENDYFWHFINNKIEYCPFCGGIIYLKQVDIKE